MSTKDFELNEDRFFSPDMTVRKISREIYNSIKNLLNSAKDLKYLAHAIRVSKEAKLYEKSASISRNCGTKIYSKALFKARHKR